MDKQGKRKIALTENVITWNIQDLPDDLKDLLIEGMVGRLQFREHFRLLLGAADRGDPMKVWPFFDSKGRIPVSLDPFDPATNQSTFNSVKRRCTNGAIDGGVQSIRIEPAVGSIVKIYLIGQRNWDANYSYYATLHTSGAVDIGYLYADTNVAAHTHVVWPRLSTADIGIFQPLSGNPPFVLTNDFIITIAVTANAVNHRTDFFILYDVVGDVPTITETGPAGCTWSDI